MRRTTEWRSGKQAAAARGTVLPGGDRPPQAPKADQALATPPAGGRRELRIPDAPPFDWERMAAFFRTRAIPGVEHVPDDAYIRSFSLGAAHGVIEVRRDLSSPEFVVTVEADADADVSRVAPRLREMFDLDADLAGIASHLAADPTLAPLVAARAAVRVFTHWDPFETAIRAILGQQVSLVAARQLNARLVERAGTAIGEPSPPRRPHLLYRKRSSAALLAAG
jgi:AraC family transcriptional regulator, regulatory protein of adaptative response / DNA-3-methyladenine glycosylase II